MARLSPGPPVCYEHLLLFQRFLPWSPLRLLLVVRLRSSICYGLLPRSYSTTTLFLPSNAKETKIQIMLRLRLRVSGHPEPALKLAPKLGFLAHPAFDSVLASVSVLSWGSWLSPLHWCAGFRFREFSLVREVLPPHKILTCGVERSEFGDAE